MRTFAQKQHQPQKKLVSSNLARSHTATPGLHHRADLMLHLQRTIGNQAGQRILQTHAEELKAGLTSTASSHVGHDFSWIPVHPSTGGAIQTKLAINTPGDEYEQEANRVVEQVMRMPDSLVYNNVSIFSKAQDSEVQRKCDKGEETEDEGWLQKSITSGFQTVAASSSQIPSIVSEVLNAPGEPLDVATRAFMEPRFRADFSNVRIHPDFAAARSAQAVNAHAYTVGEQIVFNRGRYAPGTEEGRRLLAHELTHVVQQSKPMVFQGPKSSDPGDALERQVSHAEEVIVSDKGLPSLSDVTNTVQRQALDPAKGETNAETVGSEKAMNVCEPPCGKFPWFEVAPDRFMSLCDDSVSMSDPLVTTVGCPPGGSGAVVFVSGSPAWSLTNGCSACTAPASEKKPMPKVEIGYIQSVEKVLSGGVYYKQNAAGKWEWSGNEWLCVANARDGHKTSTAPWYGPDKSGNFGPLLYPQCPSLADNPLVRLPSRKDGGTLRRMRIDGVFHIWLIAKPATGPIIFIHFWDIALWVVTELADDGDPCSQSAWNWKFNGTKVTASGPGKGSATPVLTRQTANDLKQPC